MRNRHSQNILFLGYGYVAQYFCKEYKAPDFNIAASTNISKKDYFGVNSGMEIANFPEINSSFLDGYDNFIISIPPYYKLKTDAVIDKFYDYFLNRKTSYKLIYLSATSVYGDHEGEKVQEESDLKAKSINGLARIACEEKYLEFKANSFANVFILRLAGIYGDQRNNILAIHNQEITNNKSAIRFISRINVADIAAIIREVILSVTIKNQILNISDNKPCPTNEVNNYICEDLLKIKNLPIDDNLTEVRHSSFALDNRIIDNSKMKKLLNYNFIFPSYKEGLTSIFQSLNII